MQRAQNKIFKPNMSKLKKKIIKKIINQNFFDIINI